MCVSNGPADFTKTLVALTATRHPTTELPIHTLMYRNTAVNLIRGGGGNAMLLHFPSVGGMGPGNIIDTSSFPSCADNIVEAVTPRTRGASRSLGIEALDFSVQVFDHDIYTIVLAENAAAIPGALERVRSDRRPAVNEPLFAWYGQQFPGYTFALCCFDTRDAVEAKPMLWWYYPAMGNTLMLPGIDCHTGLAPDLNAVVETDHWVVLGVGGDQPTRSGSAPFGLAPVRYTDSIPPFERAFLPNFVIGRRYLGRERNGDFLAPTTILQNPDPRQIGRGILQLSA
jgi:hypothetical protein